MRKYLFCLLIIIMGNNCFANTDNPCKQVMTNEAYFGNLTTLKIKGKELAEKCKREECSKDFECVTLYKGNENLFDQDLPNDRRTQRQLQKMQQKPEFESIAEKAAKHGGQMLRDEAFLEDFERKQANEKAAKKNALLIMLALIFAIPFCVLLGKTK